MKYSAYLLDLHRFIVVFPVSLSLSGSCSYVNHDSVPLIRPRVIRCTSKIVFCSNLEVFLQAGWSHARWFGANSFFFFLLVWENRRPRWDVKISYYKISLLYLLLHWWNRLFLSPRFCSSWRMNHIWVHWWNMFWVLESVLVDLRMIFRWLIKLVVF